MSRCPRRDLNCPGCGDVVIGAYKMPQVLVRRDVRPDLSDTNKPTSTLPGIIDKALCSYCRMEKDYYEQQNSKTVSQISVAPEVHQLDHSTEDYLQSLKNPFTNALRSKDMIMRRQQYEIEKQRREGLAVLWELSDQYPCGCMQSGSRFNPQNTVDCIRCVLSAVENQEAELEDETWIYAVQSKVMPANKALKIYLEPIIRHHVKDAKAFKSWLEKGQRSETTRSRGEKERMVKRQPSRLRSITSAEVAGFRNLEEELGLELAEALEQQGEEVLVQQGEAKEDEQHAIHQPSCWETFQEHSCDFEPDQTAMRGLRRHSYHALKQGSFREASGPWPKAFARRWT